MFPYTVSAPNRASSRSAHSTSSTDSGYKSTGSLEPSDFSKRTLVVGPSNLEKRSPSLQAPPPPFPYPYMQSSGQPYSRPVYPAHNPGNYSTRYSTYDSRLIPAPPTYPQRLSSEYPINPSSHKSTFRDLNTNEENVAWEFLEHGKRCATCSDPAATYRSHNRLCDHGTFLAREVDEVLYLDEEGEVRSAVDECYVDLGTQFGHLEDLLWAIDKSKQNKFPFLENVTRPPSTSSGNRRRPSVSRRPAIIMSSKNDRQSTHTYPSRPTPNRSQSYHSESRNPIITVHSSIKDNRGRRPEYSGEKKHERWTQVYLRDVDVSYNPFPSGHGKDDRKPVAGFRRQLSPTREAHHSSDDAPYDKPNELSKLVAERSKKKRKPKVLQSDATDKKSKEVALREPTHESLIIETTPDPSLIPIPSTEVSPPPCTVQDDPEPRSPSDQELEDNTESPSIPSTASSVDIETPDSAQVLDILSSGIFQLKESLLRGFIEQTVSEELTDGAEGSQKRAREPNSSGSSQASDRPPQKRVRGQGRDPGDGGDGSGDDDDESDPPKRSERRSPFGPSRRLKCPFYQREPEKHSRAACRGEGFADMAKLKDHIKRVHTLPLQCARCWEDMPSEEAYVKHQQAEIYCSIRPQPVDDRITQQTLRKLDFKKAPYAKAENTEQKWRIMYGKLFPLDSHIPSPYDQHGFTPKLEKVLYEALEEELTRELAPALEPILRRIKDRIPFIIQNCRQKLLRSSPESVETAISSERSESRTSDFYRRQAEETGSDSQAQNPKASSRKTQLSNKAQGKRPQDHRSSPSAGSTTDEFRDDRHTSSPESSFDRRTTPPTPGSTLNPADLSKTDSWTDAADDSINVPGSFPLAESARPSVPMSSPSTVQCNPLIESPYMTQDLALYDIYPSQTPNPEFGDCTVNSTRGIQDHYPTLASNRGFPDGSMQQREDNGPPVISDMDYLPDDFDLSAFLDET